MGEALLEQNVWLVSQRVQQPLVFSVLVGGLILIKLASMARR